MSLLQENQSAIFEPIKKQYEKIFKGFGRISKYAMSDKNLPTESKGIYAYICSYTGMNKATAYPTIRTIIKDLNISEKRFYKHMKLLVEQGYITITKERYENRKKMHNVYTVVQTPKRYLQQPENEEEKKIFDKVIMHGIQNIGYGTISQAVMRDDRLSITAKTIYAYFCSYAGNTDTALPTRETILYQLNISKPTYYKHYRQLLELGYITTSTYYDSEKKHNTTTYKINDLCEFRTKAEHKNQSTKNDCTSIGRERFNGLRNAHTNINVPNSNLSNTNPVNHQSGEKPFKSVKINKNGLIDFSNKDEKEISIRNELLKNKGIPQYYAKNKDFLSVAVRILARNQNFMSSDAEHDMILDCIAEMAAANPKTSKFGNLLDKFNKFTEIKGNSASFTWLADFETQFDSALQRGNPVRNFKGYTKASIANFFNQYENGLFDKNIIRIENSSFDFDECFDKAVKKSMTNKFENFTIEETDAYMKNLLNSRKSGI